jgi:DNA-binding protein H-NS
MADDDRDEGDTLARDRASFAPEELDGMGEEELMRLVEAVLDRLPVSNLVAVAVAAEERRQAREEETRNQLLEEFRARAEQLGLSLDRVFPLLAYRARGSGRGGGTVKYRGPHGETWAGRGRLPRWLAILEGEGHNREEYRVSEGG